MSANNQAPKKNYLKSVILQSTGLERDFLLTLEKQKNIESLLESLGVMQIEQKAPFGTAQQPGKGVEPLYIDKGETTAINFRSQLTWHSDFKEGQKERKLLLFDRTIKKWPGLQPITIILVDDKLKVLAWLESGGASMFKRASLETDGNSHILKVTSENRNSTIVTEQFEIKEQSIEKIVPTVRISREGNHCGDTLLTSGETETLMKATALIQREKGDTNQPSAQWLAFQKHLKFGATAKPQISELLEKASPAGRLYAVILLKQIDPETADRTLRKMKADKTAVRYISGCGVLDTTLDALADQILEGKELVRLSR